MKNEIQQYVKDQFEFRLERGRTREAVFALKMILEPRLDKKQNSKFGLNDPKKAFDMGVALPMKRQGLIGNIDMEGKFYKHL